MNYALGKWDHTPLYEVSQVGPFDRWPSGEGFAARLHLHGGGRAPVHPGHVERPHAEPYRKTDHLDKDLADRAIEWITGHKSLKPDLPFMMLWASGSMHSPHHAPDEYLDKVPRQVRHGLGQGRARDPRQPEALGVVPRTHKLTERIDEIPAWDSLNADEKKLYARQMEVFAAQMEYVDARSAASSRPRAHRRAGQHADLRHLRQRRQRRGRPGRHLQRDLRAERPADAARGQHAPPGHWGQCRHLPALPRGLGHGRQHALQVLQAVRAPRRPARRPGRALAQRHRGQGRDPQPVPPHLGHRADHPGGGRASRCPRVPRHPPAADDRRGHELLVRRRRRAQRQAAAVLRDVRQPRHLGPTAGRP